jgi:hypothetical protein
MAGAVEGDVFIGRKAQELRGLLKIKYPIEHGIVQDWDDMERIWQYIYSDELKTLSEEVRTFLLPFLLLRATQFSIVSGKEKRRLDVCVSCIFRILLLKAGGREQLKEGKNIRALTDRQTDRQGDRRSL